jgi:hypothetical protein
MNDGTRIHKVITQLRVDGFECDASVITAILDVEPTMTWRAGEHSEAEADGVRQHSAWMKDSPVIPCETTPAGSIAALLALFPDVFAFARLPHPCRVIVSTTIFGATETVRLFLPSAFVAQLAVMGADFDLHIRDAPGEVRSRADA